MNILIFSDSHSGLSFMRYCIKMLKPDRVIHLGDYVEDAHVMAEEFFYIPFTIVPGNCDRYCNMNLTNEILIEEYEGIRFYMTHGHLHQVKQTMQCLVRDALTANANIVLYGHTHIADCHAEPQGLWVVNPGSCGSFSGSCAQVKVQNGRIIRCKVLKMSDLEELS